ncbi:MAG TPA: helix-turn-helix domain-containing protein [Polyangiaceae bacterium]|nr:helix-turn-helix domain-containing protein [Polyangiaceae bacterium]
MSARPEAPSPELVQIRAGHFLERGGYSAYRSHGTSDFLLIYTQSGSGRFGHAAGELVTAAGDVVILEPKTRHDYGIAPGAELWELLWAHFHPKADWHAWLELPEVTSGVHLLRLADPELRPRIEARLHEMVRLAAGPLRHAESLAMNALEEVLLWCDVENPSSEREPFDARIRRALDWSCADLRSAPSLEQLAARSHLSRSRFAQLFRQQVGTTPQRYQETQRISRARELLELTERSVGQVAEDLGFASPFYFSLRFKRSVGKSPSQYRKNARRGPVT